MAKLKFALLGCGRIARKHAEALTAIEGAELAAVCDLDRTRAEKLGAQFGVPHYLDHEAMLEREQIDVVNILTPSGRHAEHTISIAKQFKKHIICEKPMALRLADADRMIKACAENGVRLFIVKQNRYNLPVIKLKQAVAAGRFGKMVLGTVRVRWKREQTYYDQDSWRGTWALDGGVFSNQASHHIDLLEWLMGEPEQVSAMTATRLVKIEAEDTGVAAIKFASGALGIVEATTAARPQDLEGSLSILGERGTVVIGGFAVNEMQVWQFVDQAEADHEVLAKYKENPPNVYGFGHQRYLKEVIACLQGDKPALVDGAEGRKSLQLVMALYESAETGKTVKLKAMTGHCRLGASHG